MLISLRTTGPWWGEEQPSLQVSSLIGHSGGGAGKGRKACNLEFEYLHQKIRCEMLIRGDDISNDVSSIFHLFFNVCLHSRSFPLRSDWRKSDSSVDGVPQGN